MLVAARLLWKMLPPLMELAAQRFLWMALGCLFAVLVPVGCGGGPAAFAVFEDLSAGFTPASRDP